jgi:hypothetical protein
MSDERRIRTVWRMRQRYHRLARVAGATGGALALALVGMLWLAAVGSAHPPGVRFYLASLLLVAAAAWLPHRAVLAWWHHVRHRCGD